MTGRLGTWSAVLVTLFVAFAARGVVNASFPGGGGTATVGNPSPGHYTVTLTRTDTGSGTIDALVTGAETDIIDSIVVVTANAPGVTQVTVRGTSSFDPVGSLGSITKTGTGPVTLFELYLADDLGAAGSTAIVVDTVLLFKVEGDVLGNITVVNDSFTAASFVSGSFLGDLAVLRGSVINLPVTGDIGTPSTPVSINVDGDVILITARAIHALTNVTGAVQTYQATGESTTGIISGSLTAGRLAVVGSGTGMVRSNAMLNAPITINGNVSVPIELPSTGSLGDITIQGNVTSTIRLLNPTFSFGDLLVSGSLIPTLGVPGSGTITFVGQPVNLVRIGGDITSGGRLEVQSPIDPDLGVNVRVIGNVAGSIVFGGGTFGTQFRGQCNIEGNLSGSLSVLGGPSGLLGDVMGLIHVHERLTSTGRIRIDGSLNDPGLVQFGIAGIIAPGSLQGQIIVNAANVGRTWTSPVDIDGTSLFGPYYSSTAASLGGGAVGLAPFHLHEGSVPNNSYFFRPGSPTHALPAILVRHYGPVAINPDIMPVVEYRDPYGTYWTNANLLFAVSRDTSDPSHRTLKIVYTNPSDGHGGTIPVPPGHYRLHVGSDELLCEQVTDTPGVEPYDFYFTVTLDCSGDGVPGEDDFLTSPGTVDCDLNGVLDECDLFFDASFRDVNTNGILDACEGGDCPCNWNADASVNSQDFFDFIADFFNGNADYNIDGYTNSQDFFDFLNCFFGGC